MNMRNMLLAATVLMVPLAAHAQPVTGPYVSLGAGYSYTQDWDTASGQKGDLSGRGGPVMEASVGYGLGNGIRVEVEGNYFQQHDRLHAAGASGGAFAQSYGGLVNALYDFDLGNGMVYPYLGAGVGYEETTLNPFNVVSTFGHVVTTTSHSGQDGGFAAQGIAGLAFPIASVPGLSVTAEYRFLTVLSDQTYGGIKFGNQYNHQGLIGIRYAFGAPAPAPMAAAAAVAVAAPAPAPARTYLVFFDWDKADLSARARQIIGEAAQASTRVAVTKIEVNGYTDRSGTVAYNQVLSVKRGDAVAAELVKDGVPQASIMVQGFGETHPLVPTANGVREAQNRRVEIILQ
jgi:OOP family OmpA-OmpF porin